MTVGATESTVINTQLREVVEAAEIDIFQTPGRHRLHFATSTTTATIIVRNLITQHGQHNCAAGVTGNAGAGDKIETLLFILI